MPTRIHFIEVFMSENKTNHKLIYADGKLSATGVKEVREFSDEFVLCSLESSGLTVEGRGLSVKSLDVQNGILEIDGEVTSVRYGNGGKESFIKRLFK